VTSGSPFIGIDISSKSDTEIYQIAQMLLALFIIRIDAYTQAVLHIYKSNVRAEV